MCHSRHFKSKSSRQLGSCLSVRTHFLTLSLLPRWAFRCHDAEPRASNGGRTNAETSTWEVGGCRGVRSVRGVRGGGGGVSERERAEQGVHGVHRRNGRGPVRIHRFSTDLARS